MNENILGSSLTCFDLSFHFLLLFATLRYSLFPVFQGTIRTSFNFGISSILVTTSGEWRDLNANAK